MSPANSGFGFPKGVKFMTRGAGVGKGQEPVSAAVAVIPEVGVPAVVSGGFAFKPSLLGLFTGRSAVRARQVGGASEGRRESEPRSREVQAPSLHC